jgi:hypothetical protein
VEPVRGHFAKYDHGGAVAALADRSSWADGAVQDLSVPLHRSSHPPLPNLPSGPAIQSDLLAAPTDLRISTAASQRTGIVGKVEGQSEVAAAMAESGGEEEEEEYDDDEEGSRLVIRE